METVVDPDNVKWRSSRIERVRSSGELFWNGFCDVPISEIPYEQNEGDEIPLADHYFRTWDSNANYKKWANDLIKSELFAKKSAEASAELDKIVDVLSLLPFKKFPRPFVLYGMTFAREMVDCERYYEKEDKPLEKFLTKDQFKTIDSLALWCWDQRFFSHAEYRKSLGEKILGEIIEDMINPKTPLFSLYSGHDYTILIILAALGVSNYPELLSFGSYLLFDVFERKNADGSSERVFSVSLNPTPFEVNEKPTQDVQTNNVKSIKTDEGEEYWPLSFFLV